MTQIREATLEDMAELATMVAEASTELGKMGVPDVRDIARRGIRLGIEAREAVFVADVSGFLVGYVAWVHLEGSAEGAVEGLGTYVREPYRNKRLAMALRDMAIQRCKIRGYKYVTGAAHVDNAAGIKSCEAQGFYPMAIVMRKDF